MNIEFKGFAFFGDTTEINFPIIADGKHLTCVVSFEVLEVLDPEGLSAKAESDEAMQQYLNHEEEIKIIVERKIRSGKVTANKVIIYSEDIR